MRTIVLKAEGAPLHTLASMLDPSEGPRITMIDGKPAVMLNTDRESRFGELVEMLRDHPTKSIRDVEVCVEFETTETMTA